MDAFLVAFGEYVRSLRLDRHLTQESLADAAGIHVTYLSSIERGYRNPSIKNVRRIAQGLEVSVKELFLFEEAKV